MPVEPKRLKSSWASQDAWAVIGRFGLERVDGERHIDVTAVSLDVTSTELACLAEPSARLWQSGTGTAFCPCGLSLRR